MSTSDIPGLAVSVNHTDTLSDGGASEDTTYAGAGSREYFEPSTGMGIYATAGGTSTSTHTNPHRDQHAANVNHQLDDDLSDDEYTDTTDVLEVVTGGDQNIISLQNVHKTYLLGVEGVPALRGVSLDVKAGEFVVILGTSGCGKTTMLNLMGTIDKPTKGYVTIAGTRIGSKTTDAELAAVRLSRLGFVFQTFNLLSNLTALENVMLPMVLKGIPAAKRKERASALLTRMGLAERMNHMPSMLSGGEQQRVTIARAVGNAPDVLLLDEPTGDLDTVNSQIVMKLLLDLNEQEGITLIMVTHDVHLKDFAHRVVRMRDGKMQSVSDIPEKSRARARADLEAFIESNGSNEIATEVQTVVEYRDVADYGPLQFHLEQKAKRKQERLAKNSGSGGGVPGHDRQATEDSNRQDHFVDASAEVGDPTVPDFRIPRSPLPSIDAHADDGGGDPSGTPGSGIYRHDGRHTLAESPIDRLPELNVNLPPDVARGKV